MKTSIILLFATYFFLVASNVIAVKKATSKDEISIAGNYAGVGVSKETGEFIGNGIIVIKKDGSNYVGVLLQMFAVKGKECPMQKLTNLTVKEKSMTLTFDVIWVTDYKSNDDLSSEMVKATAKVSKDGLYVKLKSKTFKGEYFFPRDVNTQ